MEHSGPRHVSSVDRAGLALGAGSAVGGVIVVALVLAGGGATLFSVVSGWAVGTLFCAFLITALGGPIWLLLHTAGLRRARHAVMAGMLAAMLLFVAAQTWGFGIMGPPPMDRAAWHFRWISALATSLVFSLPGALIALLMWRIAYRRVR